MPTDGRHDDDDPDYDDVTQRMTKTYSDSDRYDTWHERYRPADTHDTDSKSAYD